MKTSYSFLCGYSYAWIAGYKPETFDKINQVLISAEQDPESDFAKKLIIRNRPLADQIIDSYGKLGFLFLSRDCIRRVNGPHPLAHVYVSYYLYNFIYDCKAFLDAVATMLNDLYSVGESGGGIDFKHRQFKEKLSKKLIVKAPELDRSIKQNENWFDTVVDWRDKLIHRFSTPVSPAVSSNHWPSKEELGNWSLTPCKMLVEPHPYREPDFKTLEKKYGKVFLEIEPFCEDWIKKACVFYDHVCEAVLKECGKEETSSY